jgi:hypothetical protein
MIKDKIQNVTRSYFQRASFVVEEVTTETGPCVEKGSYGFEPHHVTPSMFIILHEQEKINLPMYLLKHHTLKTYGRVEI